MADNPLYYNSTPKSSPMYYGSGSKGPGYGGPSYYGAGAYGAYGGSYGGAYGGAYGGTSESDNGSFFGTITLGRVLRVISQRWLSVFAFLLIGLIVSFAVYTISPTIYEARSEFTMDMRRSTGYGNGTLDQVTPDYGSTYEEIFNTRISDWRSDKIVAKIIQHYRAKNPASVATDDEIFEALGSTVLDLVRHSRIITITIRSKSKALCAALANAYAESIETFTDEENKLRCDKAVSQIHGNVEKQRRSVDKVAKSLLDFRTANKVDNLRSTRDTLQLSLQKSASEILELESEQTQLQEWEKMLAAVQKNPTSYGSLAVNVPRAQEIATEFHAYQQAEGEYQKLLFAFTENHPEVLTKKKESDLVKQRFVDAAGRALQTGRSTLRVTQNRLNNLKTRQDDLRNELASVEQRIVLAESGLGQLEADFGVQNRLLEGLLLDENKARIEAESNNEIVRVGRPASEPHKPVLPNPSIIFGLGSFLSLGLGLLFVLVMDNLEDTVINLSDIEGRLSLKVLAVLPHVRRKKRAEVARYLIEDKYSHFAESIAGLRNLLESPRYQALSHCLLVISTQPGEGKTITSSSLAIAYAQTGKKTLHVDFDLRRPRLARVWDLELDPTRSFSHVLQNAGGVMPDFAALVNHTEQPNLDVIASLPPEGVSPATIFGSAVVAAFFDWARANYQHVIIDSPPYGFVGDAVSLSAVADSVIIMCCPDRTHFKPIQYCSRSLTEAGANILGVVVNDVETSGSAAFSTSGHRQKFSGYGYGKSPYGYSDDERDDGVESVEETNEFNDEE